MPVESLATDGVNQACGSVLAGWRTSALCAEGPATACTFVCAIREKKEKRKPNQTKPNPLKLTTSAAAVTYEYPGARGQFSATAVVSNQRKNIHPYEKRATG